MVHNGFLGSPNLKSMIPSSDSTSGDEILGKWLACAETVLYTKDFANLSMT